MAHLAVACRVLLADVADALEQGLDLFRIALGEPPDGGCGEAFHRILDVAVLAPALLADARQHAAAPAAQEVRGDVVPGMEAGRQGGAILGRSLQQGRRGVPHAARLGEGECGV